MKPSAIFLCLIFSLLIAASRFGSAQATEAAEGPGLHVNAGGFGSAFEPDEGNNVLFGPGVYVDAHFTHWIQVEGEARWMRWNQYYSEHQDNYLIGLRVPVYRFGQRSQIYGKTLVGLARMNFPFGGYGSFTDLAFGGTLDYRLSRKFTLRAVDFEYQYWPVFLPGQSLSPYGLSVGMAYRVF